MMPVVGCLHFSLTWPWRQGQLRRGQRLQSCDPSWRPRLLAFGKRLVTQLQKPQRQLLEGGDLGDTPWPRHHVPSCSCFASARAWGPVRGCRDVGRRAVRQDGGQENPRKSLSGCEKGAGVAHHRSSLYLGVAVRDGLLEGSVYLWERVVASSDEACPSNDPWADPQTALESGTEADAVPLRIAFWALCCAARVVCLSCVKMDPEDPGRGQCIRSRRSSWPCWRRVAHRLDTVGEACSTDEWCQILCGVV